MVSKVKPTFRIIENHDNPNDYEVDYEDFKIDFMNPDTTKDEIIAKYGIPPYKYREWSRRIRDETGIGRKPNYTWGSVKPNGTANIYRLTNCYGVRKTIHGEVNYFGYYPDLDTAIMVRNTLYENNWSHEVGDKLYEEYGVSKGNRHNEDITQLLPEFKRLYADEPTHVNDIIKQLGISNGSYTRLLNLLREEYPDIKKCRVPRGGSYDLSNRPNRYIHNNHGKYSIIKNNKYYGTFKRLEDAVNRRNYLETRGWND